MGKKEQLKSTVKSIKTQFIGSNANQKYFLAAFYNHYIFKLLKLPPIIKFPKAQFKYQDVILETRPNTIDFWATLESYEPDFTHFLVEVVKDENGTFVDVGAHIGRYSTLMAKKNWKVISFEPLKINFNALENNLKLNKIEHNATLFNFGLGNKKEEQTIYYNKLELGEASIDEKTGDSKDFVKILRFDDIYKDLKIDDFCVVKVDVEGYEEQVLEGMHGFVKEHKPLFVIELWEEKSPKLVAFLKSQGYRRLHIFWFSDEKYAACMNKMYQLYNRHQLIYDYE